MKTQDLQPTYDGYELIQNRTLLGNCIGFKPRYMSYCAVKKRQLQFRVKKVVERAVYRSAPPLSYVQQRLAQLLSASFDKLPGTSQAIAYRKGLDVHELLAQKCTGCAVLVRTDIRKYYDHVTKTKLREALSNIGFVEDGPATVAEYLTVDRYVPMPRSMVVEGGPATRLVKTLQQGSAASPAASNVVGKFLLDDPILAWLQENMEVPYRYFRYSDNITLMLIKDPGKESIEAYKTAVKTIAKEHRFLTHSWATIRPTNKYLPQMFLGTVLNVIAGVSRKKRDWTKAVLFSALVGDVDAAAKKYCGLIGVANPGMSIEEIRSRFVASIKGYAAYVSSVNRRHGKALMKLAALLEARVDLGKGFDLSKKSLVMRYKDDAEPVDKYVERGLGALV